MDKFKTYAFWVALSSAIVILVQSLGNLFGFKIESSTIENVIMSICGVLVVLGIVTKTPDKSQASVDYKVDILVEKSNETKENCYDNDFLENQSIENVEILNGMEQSIPEPIQPEIVEVENLTTSNILYIENNTDDTME